MTIDPTPIATRTAEMRAARPPAPVSEPAAAAANAASDGVGKKFPDGELLNPQGDATTLGSEMDGRPAVIILYRGAWCPYCNIALAEYRAAIAVPLRQRGVALIALSPQKPDGSLTTQEKNELDFAVLSDPGNQIAHRLGIVTQPSEQARARQLSHGLDIAEVNSDATIDIPMPTTAIVRADGTLAWIDVHPDHTSRTEPQQILDALADLGL